MLQHLRRVQEAHASRLRREARDRTRDQLVCGIPEVLAAKLDHMLRQVDAEHLVIDPQILEALQYRPAGASRVDHERVGVGRLQSRFGDHCGVGFLPMVVFEVNWVSPSLPRCRGSAGTRWLDDGVVGRRSNSEGLLASANDGCTRGRPRRHGSVRPSPETCAGNQVQRSGVEWSPPDRRTRSLRGSEGDTHFVVINNSLIVLGIPTTWQNVVTGSLILFGTGVPALRTRFAALRAG